MTLRNYGRGWPHDAAKVAVVSPAGGPFMLRRGWPHEVAKNRAGWPHAAANWHALGSLIGNRMDQARHPRPGCDAGFAHRDHAFRDIVTADSGSS